MNLLSSSSTTSEASTTVMGSLSTEITTGTLDDAHLGINGSSTCSDDHPFHFLGCYSSNSELTETLIKAIALGLIILFTIFGNVLVLMAVAVSRNLRSSTHFLIVNLAVADLLLGTTVLPFSAVFEVTGRWYFGQTFCTIWAAVDVLCCTSSILSLCVISLDRYIGVTRPLAYSAIMVGSKTYILIVLIWVSSILISIGPLLGWKEPHSDDPYFCTVNKQLGYVLFSVTGSFYLPMFIIIGVYWKIYKAALRQTKFLECGHKTTKQDVTLRVHLGGNRHQEYATRYPGTPKHPIRSYPIEHVPSTSGGGGSAGDLSLCAAELNSFHSMNGGVVSSNNVLTLAPLAKPEKSSTSSLPNNEEHMDGGGIVLRVHRGGGGGHKTDMTNNWTTHGKLRLPTINSNKSRGVSRPGGKKGGEAGGKVSNRKQNRSQHSNNTHPNQILTTTPSVVGRQGKNNNINNGHSIHHNHHPGHHHNHHSHRHQQQHHHHNQNNGSQANSSTPSPPSSSPERKLNPGFGKIAKFRRQKKAAKTLAIVVGVFLVCWLPFFFVLPLGALCQQCNIPEWLFNLFFWLGYFNSCLNPIIYGCTSREFQRAFRRILCRHSPPRPHVSRAIYRANMYNNNRFGGERHSNGPSGHGNMAVNAIPLNQWS